MIKKNDILSFYRALVFADTTDTITAASKKAYRDFCRTIDFKQRGDHSVSVESAISVLRLGLKQSAASSLKIVTIYGTRISVGTLLRHLRMLH